MAATPAPRNWAVFARRAFATTAAATVALLALAVPASAHTPKWSAGCDERAAKAWVKFELKFYDDSRNPSKVNKFVLKDGDKVLASNDDFGSKVDETIIALEPTVEHNLSFTVDSHNDRGEVNEKKTVKACVKAPPSSSTATQPPVEQPPAEQPPAEETEEQPAETTTTTVAVGVNANLAETGASIALPIGIGALLLIGGAGLLFVLRRRDKA